MIVDPRDAVEHFLVRCRRAPRRVSDVHILAAGEVWLRADGTLVAVTDQASIAPGDVLEQGYVSTIVHGPYGEARIQALRRQRAADLVVRFLWSDLPDFTQIRAL
jgi:hypothetical protein